MSETDQDVLDFVAPTETEHEPKHTERDNLIALRKKAELLEQQNLLLQQQMMNQQNQRARPVEEVEESYDFNLLEQEQFPEGKSLAKAFKMLDKKLKSYDTKLNEKDQKIAILEAAMQHKDFNDVVTPENIKKYIENDEDNLESVQKAANPGKKIYNLIKKSASYQADQNSKKSVSQEATRIQEKENKPKLGSLGVRSEAVTTAAVLSNSKMTREQRNALWKDVQSAARR